ncbi:hypothetical protein [Phenylobacterium sp. J367]|uniref:hypothetical protein n=1 Tax=Phenylobacterium sp. J367 TaxID=2898435 RepID=UPI002150B922|nr:hypothetical protein [Phenylobacterium sp. J367]MCR5877739.1 hypothetical protein [Phenylobacterium sp. J367]
MTREQQALLRPLFVHFHQDFDLEPEGHARTLLVAYAHRLGEAGRAAFCEALRTLLDDNRDEDAFHRAAWAAGAGMAPQRADHENRRRSGAAAFLAMGVALTFAALPAGACSIVTNGKPLTKRELLREAQQTVERATAIIDAEVVTPSHFNRPALLRAERVLKGPAQPYFKIAPPTSCDQIFNRVGERLRVILMGGPETFFAPDTYPASAADVDRILGSDRNTVWPYASGRKD